MRVNRRNDKPTNADYGYGNCYSIALWNVSFNDADRMNGFLTYTQDEVVWVYLGIFMIVYKINPFFCR